MKRIIAVGAVAAIALVFARPALAATKTSFTARVKLVSFGPPRRFWTSDGQSHLRGEVDSGTVSGDLRGTYSEVFNANFHGEEQATTFGSFTITTSSVTWQGVARGKITRGISTGTFVGHGTDGSKIMGGLHLDWASVLYLERRDPRLAEASHIGRPT